MCLSVCLGSSVALESIGFSEAEPGFNVRALEPFQESVREVLPFPFIYSLGSHTSCGCGFSPEEEEDADDLRESRAALVAYVAAAAKKGDVALYVSWNGDREEENEVFDLSLADLELTHDWLAPGSLVQVKRSAI